MKLKTFILAILVYVTSLTSFAQTTYKNPVIAGFYSDPSICKVGNDYYMVHSSMGYFPGLPIFHSKNLVDWQQIGYALTRKEQLPLDKAGVTLGIFAPTIRYHDGLFYIITTNITAKGTFYVTTKDPAGEWSDPIWTDIPGIDPSLFFDNDGKVYVTSSVNWGQNVKKGIYLTEIDLGTGKLLSSPQNIWEGTGGRYPEGPHIYNKDGYYYLMIAEGGTEFGHKVTIARSKYLNGPYNNNPANPILTHSNMNAETSPIQGLGHGDLVETQDNNWFMVAHAFRQFDGHQILGRETFLLPVRWDKNAWPVINGDGSAEFEMKATLPDQLIPEASPVIRNEFDTPKLSLEWNYLNNPIENNYSLTARKGFLRLIGNSENLNQLPGATFVGRRQQHHDFEVAVNLDFIPQKPNEEAGITIYKSTNYHYDLCIKNKNNKRVLVLSYQLGKIQHIEKEVSIQNGSVHLKIIGNQEFYSFEFAQSNNTFEKLGEVDTRFLSSVTVGGFTGNFIGLYATGNGQKANAPADFDWFSYKNSK
jgi:alpha-N-arabinofuranosidase